MATLRAQDARKVFGIRWIAASLLAFGLSAPLAQATTVTYSTPAGDTSGGQPVDVQATFTTDANTITVTIRNLEADPTSSTQALHGIDFTFDSGTTNGSSISSSSAIVRTVNEDGSYTDSGPTSTGWTLSRVDTTHLVLAPTSNALSIIGDPGSNNRYNNADGGIAGNGVGNPFLAGLVQFTLVVPGVTVVTQVDSVTFNFASNFDLTGVTSDHGTPTPEPSTLVTAGIGMVALGLYRAFRRRAKPKTA